MDDALTVFGLQVAENFLCPLGTLAIQSSNVLVDSHQTVSEMTLKQRF
ncbi:MULTISPECIES: hypothetical protein [Bradyrhizobium]|nr:hypothetical protein [Bradyrhizobium japonicum]WLB88817.1 hypothetical protein QIH91_40860 [Bradyrhizobium japonicum USDA 135]